jgi:hypothetical protein
MLSLITSLAKNKVETLKFKFASWLLGSNVEKLLIYQQIMELRVDELEQKMRYIGYYLQEIQDQLDGE